jgi:hypothetical protein
MPTAMAIHMVVVKCTAAAGVVCMAVEEACMAVEEACTAVEEAEEVATVVAEEVAAADTADRPGSFWKLVQLEKLHDHFIGALRKDMGARMNQGDQGNVLF